MKLIEWNTPKQCTSFWTWLYWYRDFKRTNGADGVSLRILGFRFVK